MVIELVSGQEDVVVMYQSTWEYSVLADSIDRSKGGKVCVGIVVLAIDAYTLSIVCNVQNVVALIASHGPWIIIG